MASYRIRPAIDEDHPRIVAIRNAHMLEPITLDDHLRNEALREPGEPYLRLVAVNDEGYVLGTGVAHHGPMNKPGQFLVHVRVDKEYRGGGIGRALHDPLEAFALGEGAQRLRTYTRDDDHDSRAWAERKGYALEYQMFESTCDLSTYEPAAFADAVERVQAQGIRFTDLATEYSGEEQVHHHYEITWRLSPDIPTWEEIPRPSFEWWCNVVKMNPRFNPASIILAMDGDRCVGISEMGAMASGALYNQFTGVDRAYRGRGIALAMKVVALNWAQSQGYPYLRTNNHSMNGPMLAVNRKLGYLPAPGFYNLYKDRT